MLITPAYAQAAGASPGGDLMTFLPMIAIFVVFYFLLIRPQQKRAKETRAMLESLQKGDEVITAGGIVGKISKLTDQYAAVEIAPERRDQRAARGHRAIASQGHDQGACKTRRPAPRFRSMNRYSLWKYIVIAVALAIGILYTLPELLPGSAGGADFVDQAKVDAALLATVEETLKSAEIGYNGAVLDPTGIKVRLADPDIAASQRRTSCKRSSATTTSLRSTCCRRRRSGWRRSARCRCISASTCAAACTSCCRST